MTSPHLPLALRVLAWRLRPLLVVAAVVAACTLGARVAAPPATATVPVVVADADLRSGDVLTADDLRTVRLPGSAVPRSAVARTESLIGEELAVDLPRGLPVVTTHLARSRFATSAPAGLVSVPVHLADAAVAALLRPGDRVDLVAGALDAWPSDEGPEVLAESALVLEVLTDHDEDADGLGLLGTGGTGGAGGLSGTAGAPLVIVAVPADEGHRIAAAEGGSLGAVLVGGS